MTTVTLTATFPVVEEFHDYHDIPVFADDLNRLFGKNTIRNQEIGFCENGMYWGVFYVGRKPAKTIIKELLDKAGYEMFVDEFDV